MESNIWKYPFHWFETNSYVEVFDPMATYSFEFLKWDWWRVCGALSNLGGAFSESWEQDWVGCPCRQVACCMFWGGGVSYLHIGPRKPHKQPRFLGNRTPVDVKFLSLFYENWTKIPPSSEPVHSLNNYLWDSCGMPGSATGVTLQFRKRLRFIRHINYGGEKCYWTKLRTRFVFPVGL